MMEKELNELVTIDRRQAELLWEILDDIDTAGDMFKPMNLEGYHRYYTQINRKLHKRFEVFQSDGYKLYTPEEYEKVQEEQRRNAINSLRNVPITFNTHNL